MAADKEEAIMEDLFQRMADGQSVSSICRAERYNRATVNRWCQRSEWRSQYHEAREALGSFYADRIIEEAEKATRENDHAKIAGLRLMVDSLKWTASKLNWKVYGERVDMTSGGERIGGVIALPSERPDTADAEFEVIEERQSLPPGEVVYAIESR